MEDNALAWITPNEFRSINKRMANLRKNINIQEDSFMYDLNLGHKLQCTNIEKRECLETLNKLLIFSNVTRKQGLLALEQEIEKQESLFMRKALMFITEGVDPANIRSILQNYIVVGDYKGKGLLERILIMEGILLIQAGEKPVMIKEKLSSYFGEDFIPELMRYFNDDLSMDEKIKLYCEEIMELEPCFIEDSFFVDFEKTMLALDDRSLQRLLRDVDIDDLISIMCGASGNLQMRFINNISKIIALTVINEVKERRPLRKEYLQRAQECVLNLIRILKERGEIKQL